MENSINFKSEKVWQEPYLRTFSLIREHKWKWEGILAFLGVSSGLLSLAVGILLDLIVYNLPADHLRTSLHSASIILYVCVLPLLLVGCHCLDLLEKKIAANQPEDQKLQKFNMGLLE